MTSLHDTTTLLAALADPVRLRLVALLTRHELSVAEVQEALDLAQSRASSHLAVLREAGLVRARKDGRSALYAADLASMEPAAQSVWSALSSSLGDHVLSSDARRAEALVKRRAGSESWAESVAGEMERHYSPGRTWEATAHGFLALARHGDVLDAGAGDGTLAQLIAPRAESVTLLDASERMIDAARRRLGGFERARFVVGDVQAMPLADRSFDLVLLFNVLTSLAKPGDAVREAARVLRPGGRVVVVTLARHDALEVAKRFGHRRAGFRVTEIESFFDASALETESVTVTSRERREPHFQVITASAVRPRSRGSRGEPS